MISLKNNVFLLADDHSVVRLGMSLKIKELIKDPVFHHSSSYRETIRALREKKIDILILDVNFPDGNSINIVPDILSIQPNIKILIFSAAEEEIFAMRYLQSGANGYLNKLSTDDEIKKALITFFETGKYISQFMKDKIMDSIIFKKPNNPLEQLSDREIEIAQLMIKGYGNNEISTLMKLQKTTVSTYKKRVFDKLEIDNLSSLMDLFRIYYDKN